MNFNLEREEEQRKAEALAKVRTTTPSKQAFQVKRLEVATLGPLPAYEDVRAASPPPSYEHLVRV